MSAANPAVLPLGQLFTGQRKILLDRLRRGVPASVQHLISALYGARSEGGPATGETVIRVKVRELRLGLAPYGIALLTLPNGYMIDPEHLLRLDLLLAEAPRMEIERARARQQHHMMASVA